MNMVENDELPEEIKKRLDDKVTIDKNKKCEIQEMVFYYILSSILWKKIKQLVLDNCEGCLIGLENQLGHTCLRLHGNELWYNGWFHYYVEKYYDIAFMSINWNHIIELYKLNSDLVDKNVLSICCRSHWRTRSRQVELEEKVKFYLGFHALDKSYVRFLEYLSDKLF